MYTKQCAPIHTTYTYITLLMLILLSIINTGDLNDHNIL